MINTVKAKFPPSTYDRKIYEFLCDIEDIKAKDTVVVDSSNGLGIATVIEVIEGISNKAKKYVVQKIDLTNHKKRLEKQQKLKDVYGKLEKRRKSVEEMQVYNILAKEDNEIAELLAEYKNILKED